jgi:hypothetical protein
MSSKRAGPSEAEGVALSRNVTTAFRANNHANNNAVYPADPRRYNTAMTLMPMGQRFNSVLDLLYGNDLRVGAEFLVIAKRYVDIETNCLKQRDARIEVDAGVQR